MTVVNITIRRFIVQNLFLTAILIPVSVVVTGSLNPLQFSNSPPIPIAGLVLGVVAFSYSALLASVIVMWASLVISLVHRPKPYEDTFLYKFFSNYHLVGGPPNSPYEPVASYFGTLLLIISAVTLILTGLRSFDWPQLLPYNPSFLAIPNLTLGTLIVIIWLLVGAWLLAPPTYAALSPPTPEMLEFMKSDFSSDYDVLFSNWTPIVKFQKSESKRGNDVYTAVYRAPQYEAREGLVYIEHMKDERQCVSVFSNAVRLKKNQGYSKKRKEWPLPPSFFVNFNAKKLWTGSKDSNIILYGYGHSNLYPFGFSFVFIEFTAEFQITELPPTSSTTTSASLPK